jgi:hypothetical protein
LPSAASPALTILLFTLNGERFPAEQLASLKSQIFVAAMVLNKI